MDIVKAKKTNMRLIEQSPVAIFEVFFDKTRLLTFESVVCVAFQAIEEHARRDNAIHQP